MIQHVAAGSYQEPPFQRLRDITLGPRDCRLEVSTTREPGCNRGRQGAPGAVCPATGDTVSREFDKATPIEKEINYLGRDAVGSTRCRPMAALDQYRAWSQF